MSRKIIALSLAAAALTLSAASASGTISTPTSQEVVAGPGFCCR